MTWSVSERVVYDVVHDDTGLTAMTYDDGASARTQAANLNAAETPVADEPAPAATPAQKRTRRARAAE